MTEAHLNDDDLVDLALFDLDPARSDAALRHLGDCESCRQRYAEVADGAELVLTAAPRVAPPPGFSGSALVAMGFAERAPVPRRRRRTAALLAAAALIGLLAGTAGTLVVQAFREPAAVQQAAGTPITTPDGQRVGTIGESRYEDQQVYVITVTGSEGGGSYRCELVLADGGRVHGGSWQLPAGGAATWIVPRPGGAVVAMELVTDGGQVWASAALPG